MSEMRKEEEETTAPEEKNWKFFNEIQFRFFHILPFYNHSHQWISIGFYLTDQLQSGMHTWLLK